MKKQTYSFSTINYPNGDVFLILVIQTGILTTNKSQYNYCYTLFILHVTISPHTSLIPKSFIINQSRRSHSMLRFAASPVVFSCLTSTSPIFQAFDSQGSFPLTWCSYTSKVWIYFTFKFDKRLYLTLYRFYNPKKKKRCTNLQTLQIYFCMQRIISLNGCF